MYLQGFLHVRWHVIGASCNMLVNVSKGLVMNFTIHFTKNMKRLKMNLSNLPAYNKIVFTF